MSNHDFLSPEDRRDELRTLAIKEAMVRFHREGGLWVGGDMLTWRDAYDKAFTSATYCDWEREYRQAEDAGNIQEQERLAKLHQITLQQALHDAIEQIATQAIDNPSEIDDGY